MHRNESLNVVQTTGNLSLTLSFWKFVIFTPELVGSVLCDKMSITL